jgi:hypothetical protein
MPVYQHDCDSCRFLGTFTYNAPLVEGFVEKTCDLYHCPNCCVSDQGTIVARYADEGHKYASTPVSMLKERRARNLTPEERSTYCDALFEGLRLLEEDERKGRMCSCPCHTPRFDLLHCIPCCGRSYEKRNGG